LVLLALLPLILASLLTPLRVNAQVAGAMLKGSVTDPAGAYVPKAQVSIIDVATGIEHNVTTDASGGYAAANLRPGDYKVRVTATGFAVEIRSGITLAVGAQQVLDISLRVGQMSQEVQVVGEAPTVELASSEISAEVTSNTVRELPLNGRSWTDLATLQPGVTQINTQPSFTVGADRGNRGFGSQISVSGSRPQMDNYRLDGVTMNGYSNAAPGSASANAQSATIRTARTAFAARRHETRRRPMVHRCRRSWPKRNARSKPSIPLGEQPC